MVIVGNTTSTSARHCHTASAVTGCDYASVVDAVVEATNTSARARHYHIASTVRFDCAPVGDAVIIYSFRSAARARDIEISVGGLNSHAAIHGYANAA